jgi:excinuclease ABC subunit C
LYFLQRLRDEAHRFAIEGHRARRLRTGIQSELDQLPGIGPRRKRALILHFGSLQAIRDATFSELLQVDGISVAVARTLHNHFSSDA